MSITLREVAAAIGVSHITVSRVANGSTTYVSAHTRAKVEAAIAKMGYRPNRAARALATGKTGTILLWIFRPYRPYFGSILALLEQEAYRRGFNFMVADPELLESRGAGSFLSCPSDGILAVDCAGQLSSILRSRYDAQIPLVHLGANKVKGVDCVGLDLTGAARELLEHLRKQGCRRILHMNVPDDRHDQLMPTYLQTMQDAGLKPEVLPCEVEASYSQGRTQIAQYIKANGAPDAIFCRNDSLALGVYRGLCDLGLQVPKDILLAGCDGIEELEYLPAPLTTIKSPIDQLCFRGWEILEERWKKPNAPMVREVLPAHLVIRDSTQKR